MASERVVIVGGGAIGLSAALRLSDEGYSVSVVDEAAPWQASSAAAGILFPTSATRSAGLPGEYGFRSVEMWSEWAERLGGNLIRPGGLLFTAVEDELEELAEFASNCNREVEEPSGQAGLQYLSDEAREMVRGVVQIPEGSSLDPRELMVRLYEVAKRHGRVLFYRDQAEELIMKGERVIGVRCRHRELRGEHVLLATGAMGWEWLPKVLRPPLELRQGEAVLIETDAFQDAPAVIDSPAWGPLVPRNGAVWLGGSYRIDSGEGPLFSAVADIMTHGERVFPALRGARVLEVIYGLRPVSPDLLPFVGPAVIEGLWMATGHGKDGILQSPLAAKQVLGWIQEGRGDEALLPGRKIAA